MSPVRAVVGHLVRDHLANRVNRLYNTVYRGHGHNTVYTRNFLTNFDFISSNCELGISISMFRLDRQFLIGLERIENNFLNYGFNFYRYMAINMVGVILF